MQIIQIRGGNACGKTTTVRQFAEQYKLKILEIEVSGIKTDISTNNKDIVVLGRYDKLNGGCDLFKNKKHVINTLIYIIKTIKPKIIIFEGILYGITFQMSYEINKIAKMYGYKYTGITLYRSKENGMKLLIQRNSGANFNEEHFLQKYKSAFVSHQKLVESGVDMRLINTDKILEDEMYKIIEKEIRS